jgi:hypothetical protein
MTIGMAQMAQGKFSNSMQMNFECSGAIQIIRDTLGGDEVSPKIQGGGGGKGLH